MPNYGSIPPSAVEHSISLTRLLASAMAGQALRQLEVQKNNRPSVEPTEPAYTPERTPASKRTHQC